MTIAEGLWERAAAIYCRERDAALAEVERLRAALVDAAEGLEEMESYVDGYFVEKWGLDGYVERAKEALEVPR